MVINQSKTKFMVINGDAEDRATLEVGPVKIQNCDSYTYLGCVYTQDGRTTSAVEAQCKNKWPHVAKYEAFIKKNPDAPYPVKEKVFSAALTSAILYGMETWLSAAAIEVARPMYMQCIRLLLGVRKTTAGDLCLIEAGQPSLKQKVRTIQKKFIHGLIEERMQYDDDPFSHVWRLARDARTPCARYILSLETFDADAETRELHERVNASQRTKFMTYKTLMNPDMKVHAMYHDITVQEHERLTVTKFRLSSHNLMVENGRWTRKPREERLCPSCNVVQDEQHAVSYCTINADARQDLDPDYCHLPRLFALESTSTMTKKCHELFKLFV